MMASEQHAEIALKDKQDPTWKASLPTRLGRIASAKREAVACGLDDERYDRLLATNLSALPKALTQTRIPAHRLKSMAGHAILDLSPRDRLALFEDLAPGNGSSLEAGLKAAARSALGSR